MPESVMPYLNWHLCVEHAVDVLYDQPEPANTVSIAAFATCREFEMAFAEAAGGGSCGRDWAKSAKETLMPQAIARIIALRAARSHKPTSRHNAPKPSIEQNRM